MKPCFNFSKQIERKGQSFHLGFLLEYPCPEKITWRSSFSVVVQYQ